MENKDQPINNQTNEKVTEIHLVRHKWDDEIAQENKQRRRGVFVLVLLILAFFIGIVFGQITSRVLPQSSTSRDKLNYIAQTMLSEWYFGQEFADLDTTLLDAALKGMTSFSIDPHTEYLSVDEMAEWATSLADNFVGIGVQLFLVDDQAIIQKVFYDSPAERAGVQAGDVINKVNQQAVQGLSLEEIANLVKGEIDTQVTIEFLRVGQPVSLTITRGPVVGSVFGQVLPNKIAYLEIMRFAEGTPSEVLKYMKYFADQGLDKLIIDLRDNGGGYLASVEKIASFFLSEGTDILVRENKAGEIQISKAGSGDKFDYQKLILLVNANTASASEVLAAALKQQAEAVVIGETTYGKGTVQITRNFSDGSALKFTIEKWLAPDRSEINHVGITPDIVVNLAEILTYPISGMMLEEGYQFDQVGEPIKVAQMSLKFLGYQIKRVDGYFDLATEQALKTFQKEHQLTGDGKLTKQSLDVINSQIIREWYLKRDLYDTQLKTAIGVMLSE